MRQPLYLSLIFLLACGQSHSPAPTLIPTPNDSLYAAIKRSMPGNNLQLKAATKDDSGRYKYAIKADTSGCEGFSVPRVFLGKFDNILAVIQLKDEIPFLLSGNLKLWVCNLSNKIIHEGDTLLISGRLYDIGESEKAIGYPTILTNIYSKQVSVKTLASRLSCKTKGDSMNVSILIRNNTDSIVPIFRPAVVEERCCLLNFSLMDERQEDICRYDLGPEGDLDAIYARPKNFDLLSPGQEVKYTFKLNRKLFRPCDKNTKLKMLHIELHPNDYVICKDCKFKLELFKIEAVCDLN